MTREAGRRAGSATCATCAMCKSKGLMFSSVAPEVQRQAFPTEIRFKCYGTPPSEAVHKRTDLRAG